MALPISLPHQQQPNAEAPAIVRAFTREDVLWNRPIFRAPPLNVQIPSVSNLSELAFGIRKPDALARSA